MKTLKYMPIPEGDHRLLAWAENDAYQVKILYFCKEEPAEIKIEELSKDDILVIPSPKEDIYPDLTTFLEDEKAGVKQIFSVSLRHREIIGLDQIDPFIGIMKVAGDTLADIQEMLAALGPQFVHAEPDTAAENPGNFPQREEESGLMKTLRYLPVPKESPHLLARAENDVYDIKFRYLGDKDLATVDYSELTAEDLMINVHIKYKSTFICPKLRVVPGDETLGVRPLFYIQMDDTDDVSLEEMPEFLRLLKVAEDTLSDIRELLLELVPDCVQ